MSHLHDVSIILRDPDFGNAAARARREGTFNMPLSVFQRGDEGPLKRELFSPVNWLKNVDGNCDSSSLVRYWSELWVDRELLRTKQGRAEGK
jgi:hypothetical protein